MNWINITSAEQIDEIRKLSFTTPAVIYKHSTRCSISSVALSRLERQYDPSIKASFFFIDLLAHRSISNLIAEVFHVEHESPQILLISGGQCILDASHNGISFEEIANEVSSLEA